MLEGVSRLSDDYEFLLPVASTLDPAWVRELANPWLSEFQRNTPSKLSNLHFVPDAREALHHARASIVASGTATVQAAVIGNPLIIVYRVSPLTFKLAKSLVHYPPEVWSAGLDAFGNLPIGMVNLIASHRIVPELIQDQFTAANVASALRPLLDDSPERTRMISDLADLRQKLLPQAGTSSIGQVADAVDSLLNPSSEPTCRPEAKSQLSASK
jgi:lipid-A-disaccharide synthase